MKKSWVLVSFVLAVTFLAVGCSSGPKTTDNNNQEEVAFVGETFENDFVSFTYPTEWKVTNETNESIYTMITLTRGDALSADYFMVKIQKDDTTTPILDLVNQFAKLPNVNGTSAESVTYGETEYAKTSFNYGGYDQVHHQARVGGYLATITLQGKDLEKDENVINMMNSFKYKVQ